MDHLREIKNSLVWHNEGNFEVDLVNGNIVRLNFCETGISGVGAEKCLTSTNYKYLQTVYNCLGDLFSFIDEENKRMGYKYAFDEPLKPFKQQEIEDNEYPAIATETRLRPLINYDNLQQLPKVKNKEDDRFREIG